MKGQISSALTYEAPTGHKLWFQISASSAPLANSAIMSTLAVHCQWEDVTVREKTGSLSSYAEAKKNIYIYIYIYICKICNTSYPWLPQGELKRLCFFFNI